MRKTAVAVSAAAAIGAFIAAGPAAAADPAPVEVHTYTADSGVTPPAELIGPNGEKPVEWGVATYPADAEILITPRESVGGGTWNYGTAADGLDKGCYSNYIHPSKKHSASVAIASLTDKETQPAGTWAKAYAVSGWAYTCNAYWGVY
jgi:lactococcin 972 family bacteriocin